MLHGCRTQVKEFSEGREFREFSLGRLVCQERLPISPRLIPQWVSRARMLEYRWRDSWTIPPGVGHPLNPDATGVVNLNAKGR